MLAGGDKDAQKMALQAATRPTTVSPAPTTPAPAVASFGPTSFNAGGFGGGSNNQSSVFAGATQTPTFTPNVTMSSTGKPMPVQPPQPEL
jgi:hypothetical protein